MSFELLNQSNIPFHFLFSAFSPAPSSLLLFFYTSCNLTADCRTTNPTETHNPCAPTTHPPSAQKITNQKSGTWEPTAMWHASALWCRCRAAAQTTKPTVAPISRQTSSSFRTTLSSKRYGIRPRNSTAAGQIVLPRRSASDH